MKMHVRYLMTLTLSFLPFATGAVQNGVEMLELRKSYPIQLYMRACVVSRAQPEIVARHAKELGFKEATPSVAKRYLKGYKGRAWVTSNEHGIFAITAQVGGICSLFIHQGNPKELLASMEAWLPPSNSGFSYEIELVSETKELKTIAYKIYRSTSLMEQWVITLAKHQEGQLAAIMSYNAF